MSMNSGALDYWRKFFQSANSDIFEVIKYAIIVAASDCPKEFRSRRDRIAETLFSCRLTRCLGCDHVELTVPTEEGDGRGLNGAGGDSEGGACKESKVNSSIDDHPETKLNPVSNSSTDDHPEMKLNPVSNYSYDEAEALTEEIEEENQTVGEVLRIKEILANNQDESDEVLFESLRRLQLMALSVSTLKATEIGKAVNFLRKHGSKRIRHFARALIEGWKEMVDEWVNAGTAIADSSPDSVNPPVPVVEEEEGLPSPPLDDFPFLGTQATSMELSRFFDGMDDDGNPRNSGEFNKNHEKGRKPSAENHNHSKQKPPPRFEANVYMKDNDQKIKKQEVVVKASKPSNTDSGPGRPFQKISEQKFCNQTKVEHKPGSNALQKKPQAGQQDNSKRTDGMSVERLELAKRKLHEGYQQAENAKKQRTIQVMELHDIPKQGLGHRNPHLKTGNHNRHWNGRR